MTKKLDLNNAFNHEDSDKGLFERLNKLKANGDHLYNPSRFAFIEAMAARSQQQRDTVRTLLEEKTQKALNDYIFSLNKEREHAQSVLSKLSALQTQKDQDTNQQAALYFDQRRYSLVHRTEKQYKNNQKQKNNSLVALSQLNEYLSEGEKTKANKRKDNTSFNFNEFYSQLQEQDSTLFDEPSHTTLRDEKQARNKLKPLKKLQSSISLQEIKQKKRIEHFIQMTFNEKPEDPGPLNPEKLLIGLIKSIETVSPEYLKHFISYFETLELLEKQYR